MKIGRIIKDLRKEIGLSQGELAKSCGITQTALSQIENDLKYPHGKNLEKICSALCVPAQVVVFYSLTEGDVPAGKKKIFNTLMPHIKNLIKELL
jgi:transcriptional regulator with XRE-family HTH domain